ncbi:MAG: 16S rRNA methyltransferase [Thermoprotei archaeon]|nr:MAG: 16S rRNA methyltransferase [Thermoprotei archaeon]
MEFIKVQGLEYEKRIFEGLAEYIGWTRVYSIIKETCKPVKRYFVRVNTLKITREKILERLKEEGLTAYADGILSEAIYFEVEGPFKVPIARKGIIVDKRTAESVFQGANLYAPGILRGDPVKKGDEVTVYSPNGIAVGYGIAEMDIGDAMQKRRGLAVRIIVSRYRAPKIRELDEYKKGLLYDQSYPAMLVARILDPKPGETIVDLCAAPGGKATHVAQIMGDRGLVVAVDRSRKKVEKLAENSRRLGLKSIRILLEDSRRLHVKYPSLKADKVILDPSCSSLGVRPKLIERKTFRDIISCFMYQQQFLPAASSLLKKNGILVYSTCTLTLEENEHIVRVLVEKYGFEVEEQDFHVAERGLGDSEWCPFLQRFHPDNMDTPGFFIAKLRKKT